MHSSLFNKLSQDAKYLAKFCVTQLPMKKSYEEDTEFEGQVYLPIAKASIADACHLIALASVAPLEARNTKVTIHTPANDIFVIEAQGWKLVLTAEEGRLKVESSGTNFEEMFNRKEILRVIDSQGLQKVSTSLADIVLNAFTDKKEAVVNQSAIQTEDKLQSR